MVSFTLVPMLASRWLKAHDEENLHGFAGGWERGFDRPREHVPAAAGLGAARIGRSWSSAGFSLLVLSILPLPLNLIGQEYAPNEDDGQFTINSLMPPGYLAGGEQRGDGAASSRDCSSYPEVDSFTTTVGGGDFSRSAAPIAMAQIAVQLSEKTKRNRSVFDVIQDVRKLQAGIPGMQIRTSIQAPLIGSGGGVPINVRVVGNSITQLQQLARQVEQVVRDTPGTVDIYNDADLPSPRCRRSWTATGWPTWA